MAGEWGVHRQAHAVAHDGEQDKEVEWLPLHKGNAVLSEGIFERQAAHGFLSSVRGWLGPHPPGRLLGVHLGLDLAVAIGRRAIQSGIPRGREVGWFSSCKNKQLKFLSFWDSHNKFTLLKVFHLSFDNKLRSSTRE